MDLRDLENNVRDGLHIASLGGALIAVVGGLGGVRDHDHRLAFAPRMPPGLERLCFPIVFRGRRLLVEVRPDAATYTLGERDEPLEILHCGEPVRLCGGAPERRPLPDPPDLEPPRQPAGREPERVKRRMSAPDDMM